MIFIPAILSSDRESATEQIFKLLAHFDQFQIDVQDGIYVPSKTITIEQYAQVLESQTTKDIMIDFHLMLTDYKDALLYIQQHVNTWHHLCVRTVFVHTNIPKSTLAESRDFTLSMTFNPGDAIGPWREYIRVSSNAQVMTIHPGPQGQGLILNQLKKVGEIHMLNPDCSVCIDGSVNDKTLSQILHEVQHNIPEEMGVGSYFSKAPPSEVPLRLARLQEIYTHLGPA